MPQEGLIGRKPDAANFEGKNTTKDADIEGCIDFTVQNTGNQLIRYGFSPDNIAIPLGPNELANWPLYRACEVWTGKIYFKFGNLGGNVNLYKTI